VKADKLKHSQDGRNRDASAEDQPMKRATTEAPQPSVHNDWISHLRALHADQPGPPGSAVEVLQELRDPPP
jgi:hypothetical protein